MIDRLTPLRARVRNRGQRMKRHERRDLKRQFLMTYAHQPVAQQVCQQLGISRSGFYQWLKTDERFKAKYEALSAVYYDIWLWCEEEKWREHLRRRRAGHRLIRHYFKQDVIVANAQTWREVARVQKHETRNFELSLPIRA